MSASSRPAAATAHGKVILFGEHAVVYGVPAIAVGIERGARAWSSPLARGHSTLRVSEWNRSERSPASLDRVQEGRRSASEAWHEASIAVQEDDGETPIACAFRDLLRVTRDAGEATQAVAVEAEADLPPGGGLGCSAALGVAIARALDPSAPPEVIAERVGAWESVFHGNASGVDAAVASLGGCVLFERGTAASEGSGGSDVAAPRASTITRIRVPGAMHICIGNSGQASSTRSMVEAVARQRQRRPETTQRTFDAIHTLVKNARLAIEAADRRAVGQLLDLNQMLLSGLFVSTPEIEQMCSSARAAGALGAKLTGAGGGGCVVALVDHPDDGARVLGAWKKDGFDGFLTTFGVSQLVRPAAALLEGTP
jgi:mevalonate kinase